MNRTQLLTTAAIAALLPQAGAAQDVILLDDIVASASLIEVEAGETGATVDKLDEDDLEEGPLSAGRSIDRLPGTSFSANGGLGALGSVRVRGLNDFYVATRIDGIDVSDPSYVQPLFDFGGMTRAGLQGIELVKGSQSALYGSEAIAGVIDITTFRATEEGTTVRTGVEVGSHDTWLATFGVATRAAQGGLAFNISRVQSDGISAAAAGTEPDAFEETFVTLSGDYAITDAVTLGFSALYADTYLEIDGFPAPAFTLADTDDFNTVVKRGGRVFAQIDAFGAEHEFSYASFDTDRADPNSFFDTDFAGDRETLAYLGTMPTSFGSVSLGLERTEEEAVTTSFSGETATNSIFGEVLMELGDADLSLALRHDNSDDFGGNTSGRVAVAYDLRPDLTLKAVAGTGFRVPSLYERFSVYGTPGLEIEESRSVEFGAVKEFANGAAIEATAFYTEIDNRIDFDTTSTACTAGAFFPGCYEQVGARTFTRGIELAAELPITEDIDVFGSYTFTDATRSGARLLKVPRHDIVLGIEGQIMPRLTGTADIVHVADKPVLDDYTLVGLGLSYETTDTTEAYLRVDNIFDEDYETSQGYNAPGRVWSVGLRAEF